MRRVSAVGKGARTVVLVEVARGGRGGVGGVVLGTLLLALVANLLVLWHVSVYWEGVVVGAALLGVLATDGVLRRKC